MLFKKESFDIVIHLAAQAGVRYSITNPETYIESNLKGFSNIIEASVQNDIKHFVYASSSSVYGSNTKMPFSEKDPVDHPCRYMLQLKNLMKCWLMLIQIYTIYLVRDSDFFHSLWSLG